MKLIFAAALAAVATSAAAQELSVRLKDGSSWTIKAEHTRRAEGMGPAQNWSLTTVKRLTWHAGGKGRPATLTVTPLSAIPGEGSPAELAAARSLAIPATLVVSESLAPGEIVNRDEVRAEFRRLVPNAPNGSAEVVDASSKAMIASELAIASRGEGFNLKLKQPISGDTSISNPLGGPLVRAVETVELAAVDDKTGRAIIRWRQTVDPASFKASTVAMLEAMAKDKVDPAKIAAARAVFASASMTNDTICLYEIDMRTGLARRGDCTSDYAFSAQGKSQKINEHWAISQTPPDPA